MLTEFSIDAHCQGLPLERVSIAPALDGRQAIGGRGRRQRQEAGGRRQGAGGRRQEAEAEGRGQRQDAAEAGGESKRAGFSAK